MSDHLRADRAWPERQHPDHWTTGPQCSGKAGFHSAATASEHRCATEPTRGQSPTKGRIAVPLPWHLSGWRGSLGWQGSLGQLGWSSLSSQPRWSRWQGWSGWFRRLGILLGLSACLGLIACASVEVEQYRSEKPVLDLKRYLNGDLRAWGMFTDRFGKVVRRFEVRMQASWKGSQGILEEDFFYSDGTTERRVWTIDEIAPGRFRGRAGDVIGEAVGVSAGNALNWRYTLALPIEGRVWHVQFDDWMYLIDEQVMINRAKMSKFGIELGEVTLSFTREKRP